MGSNIYTSSKICKLRFSFSTLHPLLLEKLEAKLHLLNSRYTPYVEMFSKHHVSLSLI